MNKGQNWLKFSDFSCTYTLSLHLPCAGLFQFRCLLLPLILQAQSPYARMSSKSFFHKFIFIFKLGGTTKHLMTGSAGNSEFCFPSTLMFPVRVSGKQNSLFPVGPVIKRLLFTHTTGIQNSTIFPKVYL